MDGRLRATARYGTIFRYIAWEAIISFLVAFLFFFGIFFVNQLLLMAEQILSKRAPFGQVALLILYSLPAIVAMAAPFAALVGTLMAAGRISSDNEVLVMRASGLSYSVIFIPFLAVGILVSSVSFFANDVLLPAGTLEFGKVYRRLLLSTPSVELESNTVKRYEDVTLVTGNVEGGDIGDLLVIDRNGNGERRVITAKSATVRAGTADALSLDMKDAFVQSVDEASRYDFDYAFAGTLGYAIRQKDVLPTMTTPGPREMSSRDVATAIATKQAALEVKAVARRERSWEQLGKLESALREGKGSQFWGSRTGTATRIRNDLAEADNFRNDRSLRIYRLEYYKKFSIPFGALSFVFLAVPLGMLAKKSGQSVGFGIGLLIAVVYWAMLIGGQTLGTRLGYSPFWAMWLPNIVAVVAGSALAMARLRR